MDSITSAIVEPVSLLFAQRQLIVRSVRVEFRNRTAGTAFGVFWLLLNPVILLTVYALVYLVIFRFKPASLTEVQYVLYLFCGLVSFIGMSEAVSASMSSLSAHVAMLSSTVFPVEILPVRSVLATQSGFFVGLAILLVACIFVGKPTFWWFTLPLLVILQLAWLIGLAWILSVANLVFRDLQNIIGYVLMILMIVSPIAYTPDMIPPPLRILIWFNPFAYFILAFQKILLLGTAPTFLHWLALLLLGVGGFALGYALFSRVKGFVVDYA